jgi:hypothetical protein
MITEERQETRQERMTFDCAGEDTFAEEPTNQKFLTANTVGVARTICGRAKKAPLIGPVKLSKPGKLHGEKVGLAQWREHP